MTSILRRGTRPIDLPPPRPSRPQCACPVDHGTHTPGRCLHTVTDGPITVGCPCGTRPDAYQEVTP